MKFGGRQYTNKHNGWCLLWLSKERILLLIYINFCKIEIPFINAIILPKSLLLGWVLCKQQSEYCFLP